MTKAQVNLNLNRPTPKCKQNFKNQDVKILEDIENELILYDKTKQELL